MSEQELAALGEECAENDSHVGITGMLLHKRGNFLQAIEGSRSAVGDMYAKIMADPRHTNIRLVSDRMIPHQEFWGGTVGFKNLDELPATTPYLNPFSYETFAADPDLAILVLQFFFRSRMSRRRSQAS
jgi:hypothetical protein